MAETNQVNIQVVIERIAGLHEDVNDLRESTRDSMREIALAVNKLVLIEERQSKTNESFTEVLKELRDMKSRIVELEKKSAITAMFNKWSELALMAAATGTVMYIARATGLIP